MMEDDPDYGYYCETAEDDVTPVITDIGKQRQTILVIPPQ